MLSSRQPPGRAVAQVALGMIDDLPVGLVGAQAVAGLQCGLRQPCATPRAGRIGYGCMTPLGDRLLVDRDLLLARGQLVFRAVRVCEAVGEVPERLELDIAPIGILWRAAAAGRQVDARSAASLSARSLRPSRT